MDKILKKASEDTLRKVHGGGMLTGLIPGTVGRILTEHVPYDVGKFLVGAGSLEEWKAEHQGG